MTTELHHFIGGEKVQGTSGRFGDVFTPMTGEVSAKVPLASKAEVRAAIENALAVQPAWAAWNPQRRARVMFKVLQLVQNEFETLAELLARVEALARRRDPEAVRTKLVVGDLEMDLLARTVNRGEEEILLQPREFRLLEFLMKHSGQVVTRTMLLEKVWGSK